MKTKSVKNSLKGWKILSFLKGRKKLLITAIGAITAYVVTQDPAIAGIVGAGSELLYAVLDFYLKE